MNDVIVDTVIAGLGGASGLATMGLLRAEARMLATGRGAAAAVIAASIGRLLLIAVLLLLALRMDGARGLMAAGIAYVVARSIVLLRTVRSSRTVASS